MAYQLEYTGAEVDRRLGLAGNIPTKVSDLTNDSGFITKSVNDLVNYYLKSETYTKAQVESLIAAISQFRYVVVATLPTASADTMNKIYLVPSDNPETQNVKDEYITVESNGVYSWEQIGSTSIDISGKADKDTDAIEGNLAKFDSNGNPVDAGIAAEKVAQIDGYYGSLTAGTAENLVGRGTTEAEYVNRRTSAGTADIGSGSAAITRIKGRSVVWNQLVANGDFSDGVTGWPGTGSTRSVSDGILTWTADNATASNNLYTAISFINGHKYYISFFIKGNADNSVNGAFGSVSGGGSFGAENYSTSWKRIAKMATPTTNTTNYLYLRPNAAGSDGAVAYFRDIRVHDLTLLGIDNLTTVAEVEAWLAENIGPLDYYAYNPGEVINNAAEGIKTRGFNLFNYETGKAYLPGKYSDYPYEYEICGTFTSISFTDVNGNTSVPELHDGRFFNVDAPGELTVVGGNNTDTLVHLVWSGWRNYGEPDYVYEPYWENTLNLGLTSLTGKLNGEGSSVVVFPHGLAKVGDVQDEIVGNRAIKRVGVVDMGTLNWNYASGFFYTSSLSLKTHTELSANFASPKYLPRLGSVDGHIWLPVNSATLRVYDSKYSAVSDFKTANTGVLLYYELATPEEYILDNPPQFNYRVDDFSTEETVPSYDPANVIAPLAYDVQYAMNAVDAIRRLPDNYVERKDVKQVPGDSDKFVLSQKAVNDNYAKKVGVEDNLTVGLAKNIEGNATSGGYPFTFVKISGTDGLAKINDVRGKSLVWNQLVQNGNFADGTTGWVIFNGQANAIVQDNVFTATLTADGLTRYKAIANYANNHIVLLKFDIKATGATECSYRINNNNKTATISEQWKTITLIESVTNNTAILLGINGGVAGNTFSLRNVVLFDLTLMFGAGNEPATVEEFEALFPMPYYAYNAGEIISNKTEQVKVVGFNQWDEEWENGYYDITTGAAVPSSSYGRCKNPIPVLPNTSYFGKGLALRVLFYDAAGNYIGWAGVSYDNHLYTTPTNCRYIKFYTSSANITGDICINLSDPAKNGTYEPYKTNTIELNLPTLTGKVNGEGESVVIASDGLKSAGSAYDEFVVENGYITKFVKRFVQIDLGDPSYQDADANGKFGFLSSPLSKRPSASSVAINAMCSKYSVAPFNKIYGMTEVGFGQAYDESLIKFYDPTMASKTSAQLKAALSGEKLIYELAEPVTYVLDTPIPATFQSYKGGTLKQIPENGSVPTTAPCAFSVTYAIDAASLLTGLPQNYISKESLQAMLTAMQSAGLFSSYTMTFNSSTGKYEFTFIQNA